MQLKADLAERNAEIQSKDHSLRDLSLRVNELEADKVWALWGMLRWCGDTHGTCTFRCSHHASLPVLYCALQSELLAVYRAVCEERQRLCVEMQAGERLRESVRMARHNTTPQACPPSHPSPHAHTHVAAPRLPYNGRAPSSCVYVGTVGCLWIPRSIVAQVNWQPCWCFADVCPRRGAGP
jgi:hypothetical protein